jgi:hypothetical protein
LRNFAPFAAFAFQAFAFVLVRPQARKNLFSPSRVYSVVSERHAGFLHLNLGRQHQQHPERTMTSTTTHRLLALAAIGTALTFGLTACKSKSDTPAPITDAANDPAADGNLAPTDGSQTASQPASQPTQVLGTSSSYTPQQQSESYANQPAPIVRQTPDQSSQDDQNYNNGQAAVDQADQSNDQPVEYADQAPPPLPDYDQPPAPEPDYLWTPGYWGWGPGGYYWVPGVWCPPPYYGALWTPPYWGYYRGRYGFHRGYWGPHIGFYGGVNYGFGYIGIGFFGGYWRGHDFYYNRAVTNVGHVTNIYNRTVIYNNVTYGPRPVNRVSYNGGRGGIDVRPRPAEIAAFHEPHAAPLAAQMQVRQQAAQNRGNFYADNHGRPAEAAIARPIAPAHIEAAPRAVEQVQQRSAQIQQQNIQRQQAAQQPHNDTMMRSTAPAQQQPHNDMMMRPTPGPQQQQPQQHNDMMRPTAAVLQPHPEPQQPHNDMMRPTAPALQPHPEPQQPHNDMMMRPTPGPQQQQRTNAPVNVPRPEPTHMAPSPAPQDRMVPVERPQPQPQQQERPVEQPRPQPQEQPRPVEQPRPQPQAAPRTVAPAPRPAPQQRAAPAPAPHEEKPR